MASWNQQWQMPFQLHRLSSRWLAVIAKQTVLLPDVLAEHGTYPVPIFASAAVTVRMMRTHRADTKLMMTMIVMICKDSLVTYPFLSWAACWFLIDTNLHYRSCLITCKTLYKTEIFSKISLWLNLAYLLWHCSTPWPWKWWSSCQNQISTLFRSWDIDKKLFYGRHFVKSKMAAI